MRYDLLHPKALRKAVIEHLGTEHDVPQERQFRRWVSGDTPVPGWARRVIDEIMGAPEPIEVGPAVTTRILAGILALEAKAGVSEVELGHAAAAAESFERLATETDRRIARRLAASRRTPGEQGSGPAGAPAGGSPGSSRRTG